MAHSQYPRNPIRLRFHSQYEHGIGRAFEHGQNGFQASVSFGAHRTAGSEPARIDHASSLGWFDHELIPLFSLYPFQYFHL